MLELLRQGTVSRELRLKAAYGGVADTDAENLRVLAQLLNDDDAEVRSTAAATLDRMADLVAAFLSGDDVPDALRDQLTARLDRAPSVADDSTILAVSETGPESVIEEAPHADAMPGTAIDPFDDGVLIAEEGVTRESIQQKISQMGVPERVAAAVKGSREVRALLIRDPNRMIASAVLTSPKLTESEVESFARMGNVSEDVLRIIGSNRGWMKSYGVMSALVKNAKTPLAMSLSLMHRLHDRDLVKLASDRNVMEPLRVAAKRKVVNAKI